MLIYFIVLIAVATRFVPHVANAAPITALAIFAAANLPMKKAVGVTFAARFISDIFLGFFQLPLLIAVYASHFVGLLFGKWIKNSQNYKWAKIVGSSLFASVLFFLVTNFAFFYSNYPHNWQGILTAYTNGLPFFKGTLVGDLGYTLALFGAYEIVLYAKRNQKQAITNVA